MDMGAPPCNFWDACELLFMLGDSLDSPLVDHTTWAATLQPLEPGQTAPDMWAQLNPGVHSTLAFGGV